MRTSTAGGSASISCIFHSLYAARAVEIAKFDRGHFRRGQMATFEQRRVASLFGRRADCLVEG